jgi:hypothetical protein
MTPLDLHDGWAAVREPGDPARELIVAGSGAERAVRHFAEDVAAALSTFTIGTVAAVEPGASLDPLVLRGANQLRGGGGTQ